MKRENKSIDLVHIAAAFMIAVFIGMGLLTYGAYMIAGAIVGTIVTSLVSLMINVPWWSGSILGAVVGLAYAYYKESRPASPPTVLREKPNHEH